MLSQMDIVQNQKLQASQHQFLDVTKRFVLVIDNGYISEISAH